MAWQRNDAGLEELRRATAQLKAIGGRLLETLGDKKVRFEFGGETYEVTKDGTKVVSGDGDRHCSTPSLMDDLSTPLGIPEQHDGD